MFYAHSKYKTMAKNLPIALINFGAFTKGDGIFKNIFLYMQARP